MSFLDIWMGNDESTDDIVSRDEEWKESDFENPSNIVINLFLKPCLKTQKTNSIEKEDEQSQWKRKDNNMIDEQPSNRLCNAKKFEAIKYSLGPNEEYIAIRRCEYNAWERNEDNMSQIYREFFLEKGQRMEGNVHRVKEAEEKV
nr:hypothetical protein [Tanacetum cinerariifolium]